MLTRTQGLMDKIPQLMWPLGRVVLTLRCYKERFGLKAEAVINQRKKERHEKSAFLFFSLL